MTPAFRTLLAAKTISALGSQVTVVALPLTAILILHTTPFDMGLLGAMSALPSVLFGLLAGAVIGHLPKRAVLLTTNLAAATALAAGGIGAVAGALLSGAAAARFNVNALLAIAVGIGFVTGLYVCTLAGAPLYVAFGFAAAQAVGGIGNGLLGAAMMTYFQTAVPPEKLARLLGALTTIIGASVPLGALAAGAIANATRIRPTLILLTAGFGATLAVVVITARATLLTPPKPA